MSQSYNEVTAKNANYDDLKSKQCYFEGKFGIRAITRIVCTGPRSEWSLAFSLDRAACLCETLSACSDTKPSPALR